MCWCVFAPSLFFCVPLFASWLRNVHLIFTLISFSSPVHPHLHLIFTRTTLPEAGCVCVCACVRAWVRACVGGWVCVCVFSYPNNHPCGRKASSLMRIDLMASSLGTFGRPVPVIRSYNLAMMLRRAIGKKGTAQKQPVFGICSCPISKKMNGISVRVKRRESLSI